MSGAGWEQLRGSLAIAILGFTTRGRPGGVSLEAAERMLDALSEPDGPLPGLRDLGGVQGPTGSATAQVGCPPFSDAEVASICLSRRHDFGLLSPVERAAMVAEARAWELAFGKERELAEMRRAVSGDTTTSERQSLL